MAELVPPSSLSSLSSLSSHSHSDTDQGSWSSDQSSHTFIQDIPSGQVVCKNCGWVKETHIVAPGWECPRFFPSTSLSTTSSRASRTFRMSISSPSLTLRRAFKLDQNKSWAVRKVEIGSNEIRRLSAEYELGKNVISRAEYLFRKAVSLPRFQIHYTLLMARVCFFYTVKMTKNPIRLEEILADGLYSTKLGYRYYTILLHDLQLPHPLISPLDFLQGICSQLQLNPSVCRTAKTCVERFLARGVGARRGYNMRGIAAGGVYLACKLLHVPMNQQNIARAVGISDITLRARFKELARIYSRSR